MDDIVITCKSSTLISQLQEHFHPSFHIKDLGHLKYFLNLEAQSTSDDIFLHQHKYTRDLISLTSLRDGCLVCTLLEVNFKYCRDDDDFLYNPSLYWRWVGSLNYLTITQPDISFSIQMINWLLFDYLCQFTLPQLYILPKLVLH